MAVANNSSLSRPDFAPAKSIIMETKNIKDADTTIRPIKAKRKYEDLEIDGFDMSSDRPTRAEEEENLAKLQNTVRNVLNVVYCNMKFQTWFRSPMYFEDIKRGVGSSKPRHPTESGSIHFPLSTDENVIDTLYVCDTCMKYSTIAKEMAIHMPKCTYRNELPGRVVYDSPYYQIRKVDGSRHQFYAQCLSLFAKFFLDSKSIFFSVENFDYYLLTISVANIRVLDTLAKNNPRNDESKPENKNIINPDVDLISAIESESVLSAQRVIGFFSKEKVSWDNYNLACITVFPPFQQRGLGRLLISYSYYLSKKARVVGTPERPLSEHGFASYLSYWCSVVAQFIDDHHQQKKGALESGNSSNTQSSSSISIDDISKGTYLWQSDIVQALQSLGALEKREVSVSTTKRKSLTTPPVVKYVILLNKIQKYLETRKNKTQGPILIEGYCLVRKRTRIQKS